jgi:4-amino-4-deoxy-L-arabinose transferase-like glycosyltransferase
MRLIKNWEWGIVTAIFFIIVITRIPSDFYDLRGDSAQYMILGESLSGGTGFRMVNYPGEPFCFYYPPVFPLLLFPLITFLGRNFYALHFFIALLGYASLWCFYLLFKRYTNRKIAFFSAVFLAMNPTFIVYSAGYILSDIPYLFFSGLTLLMACGFMENSLAFPRREGFFLLAGLLLSYFCRYAGVTLFLGVIAALFFSDTTTRNRKIIFLVSGFLLACGAWNIFKMAHPAQSVSHLTQIFRIDPYAPYKGTLFDHPVYFMLRFIEGANYYYNLLPAALFLPLYLHTSFFLRELVPAILLSLTFLGFWCKFKEYKTCVFHYYFLAYFLLIIFWPFREDVRFLLPILPCIFFYCVSGISISLDFLLKGFSRYCFYPVMGVCVILSAAGLTHIEKYHMFTYKSLPGSLKNYVCAHRWMEKNLKDTGVVLSRKPTVTYFYTRHKAINYPFTFDPDLIWGEIKKNNVAYIVVDEFSGESRAYLGNFIFRYKDSLELIYRQGNTGVFKVHPLRVSS